MSSNKTSISYKDAGVDIDAGEALVERIKGVAKRTARPEVLGGLGGFGALCEIPEGYRQPVLVSGTDGVGTKLRLAIDLNKHEKIGIDLVAMCVNDLIVSGAEPLFFLDYYATGKLNVDIAAQVVTGIGEGCEQAGCALVGGETAEMPGMYKDNEYDLAGFAVGIAEKSELITGDDILCGDVIIGLPSSGIHSNGYSLVRKIIENLDLDKTYEGLSRPLGEALLAPTKIYAKALAAVMKEATIKGVSHITGGGFYENFPRMLPDGLGVQLERSSWHVPEIFHLLQEKGNIPDREMFSVFNMGIGMALVVDEREAESVLSILQQYEQDAAIIGSVTSTKGVHISP